jgi:hypothetical protein
MRTETYSEIPDEQTIKTKKRKSTYSQTSRLEKTLTLSSTSSTRPQLEEAVLNGLFP